MSKISCIYKITSKINNKVYIGSAIDFNKRKWHHIGDLRNNRHKNQKLQAHVNKYGLDDICMDVIEIVDDNLKLIEREQYYIDLFNCVNNGFNISPVAGNTIGVKCSEETKQKIRNSKLGKKLTEEHKEKIRISLLGNKRSKGKKISDKQKEQISLVHKGKKLSKEHVDKIQESRKLHFNKLKQIKYGTYSIS